MRPLPAAAQVCDQAEDLRRQSMRYHDLCHRERYVAAVAGNLRQRTAEVELPWLAARMWEYAVDTLAGELARRDVDEAP
jgi:hypothetical protein